MSADWAEGVHVYDCGDMGYPMGKRYLDLPADFGAYNAGRRALAMASSGSNERESCANNVFAPNLCWVKRTKERWQTV